MGKYDLVLVCFCYFDWQAPQNIHPKYDFQHKWNNQLYTYFAKFVQTL